MWLPFSPGKAPWLTVLPQLPKVGKGWFPKCIKGHVLGRCQEKGEDHTLFILKMQKIIAFVWHSAKGKTCRDGEWISDCQGLGMERGFDDKGATWRTFLGVMKLLCVKTIELGLNLAVQWLRLCTPNVGDTGCIPDRGTKIPHATQWPKTDKQANKKNFELYSKIRVSFAICNLKY